MRASFSCGCTAVVACGAIGAAVEQAVIRFGARPCAGGFVAILTNRLATMNGACRLARSTEAGAGVAGCALGGQRHIGMEDARVPAGGATLVATVAVGNRHATERLVRYVVSR